ncbi:MAG: hypothetical protein ACPG77_19965 [Nannocystaceae bacterium]
MSQDTKSMRKRLRQVRQAFAKCGSTVAVNLDLEFACPVAWEAMDEVGPGVRHCSDCDCDVHDFTGLSRSEVVAHIRRQERPTCGQVMARSDGRIVFGACAQHVDRNLRGRLVVTPVDGS